MNAPTTAQADVPASAGRPSPNFLWCLLVLGTATYFGLFVARPALLPAVGINYLGVWFLDSFAILASNDALARGLDVYAPNALDYLQRPHVYSHWWLGLGNLGLTRASNLGVGLALTLAFFAVALTALRPRKVGELLWYLCILCSSPVLLAVHRANNDLVVFLLLAGMVPCLVSPFPSARLVAAVIVALATGLKFYPAAAGLLLLAGAGASSPTVRRGLLVGAAAITLVLASLVPDLQRMGAMLPHVKAEGLMSFGAGNVLGIFGIFGWAALAVGAAAAVAIGLAFWRANIFKDADAGGIEPAEWLRFVLGATLLTACFFTGMNFGYRWIFALWLGPFLWKALREHPSIRVRRFAAITAGLMGVALWADAFAAVILTRLSGRIPGEKLVHWADRFFLFEQPLTWAFFACLIGWLVHFTRTETRLLISR
ncbi:MAG: hypothetical protein ABIZ81_00975 [Opitutaceae bacterium]